MVIALSVFLGLMAITLHELGHYEAMRRCGVWVKEVSLLGMPIGFLPSLRYTHRGTTWCIHPFLIGAYVQARTEGFVEQLSLRDRLYIYGNGIVANVIYAILLICTADVLVFIEQKLHGTALMVAGAAIGFSWLLWYGRKFVGIVLMVLSFPILGVVAYMLATMTFTESLDAGGGGPVAIGMILTKAEHVTTALRIAGFLSLNLAAVNLLPLPIVDGGHMFAAVVHRYFGKRARTIALLAGAPIILYIVFQSFALDVARIWRWMW